MEESSEQVYERTFLHQLCSVKGYYPFMKLIAAQVDLTYFQLCCLGPSSHIGI